MLLVPCPTTEVAPDVPVTAFWERMHEIHLATHDEDHGHRDGARRTPAEYRQMITTPPSYSRIKTTYALVDDGVDACRVCDTDVDAVDPRHIIGRANTSYDTRTNLDTVMFDLYIDAPYRGRGFGTAVLDWLKAEAGRLGRGKMATWLTHRDLADRGDPPFVAPTGEVPGHDRNARFAARHGFTLEFVEKVSELNLNTTGLADKLHATVDELTALARDYRLETLAGYPDEAVTDEYVAAINAFNADMPSSDNYEPTVLTVDEVLKQSAHMRNLGMTGCEALLWHVPTSSIVGYTEISIANPDATRADQDATWVAANHRGKKLATLIKYANILNLMATFPSITHIRTENAEENAPMWAINKNLGFVPASRASQWWYKN